MLACPLQTRQADELGIAAALLLVWLLGRACRRSLLWGNERNHGAGLQALLRNGRLQRSDAFLHGRMGSDSGKCKHFDGADAAPGVLRQRCRRQAQVK